MNFKLHSLFIAAAMSGIVTQDAMAQKINQPYPTTQKVEQEDNYFGTIIKDPYRWLENDTAKNTEEWVDKQVDFTSNYLSKIPYRKKLEEQLKEVWNYAKYSAPSKEGEHYIFYKNDGLQNQSVLFYQKGINGNPEVLIDPNKLSKDGTVALESVVFSKNQKYVAYSVSASGSDWQEIYIMDFPSKKLKSEKIEYVKFGGISWKGDDGFYYSGYDAPKDEKTKYSAVTEYQKIFYHKIGTPQSDDILVYEDKDKPLLYKGAGLTEDERFLVLYTTEGTDGVELKVMDMKNQKAGFTTIIPGYNTNASVVDNVGDQLLVLTNQDAPNYKLVSFDFKNPSPENWKVIIPEQKEALEGVSTGGGKLFARYLKDANSNIAQYDYNGTKINEVSLPGIGSIAGFGAKKEDKNFYYTYTSFTTPSEIYEYDISTGQSKLFRKSELKMNTSNYETKQVFYTSKDGTKVPMFITYKKGIKLDGSNPTLLYAYGGFNISLTPSFSLTNAVFLENGGIYCVANLRGGAEYGEEWHKGGMLENKQNVFDDFISAAEYLIDNGYTKPERLAIKGGSNGGLLVGAVMTQRPDLFGVALPGVGVLDMLRFHKFTVGWGWVVEYGSSDNEKDFRNLLRYSPLHNVHKICYPATMITTADHDDRVVPAHSFKFGATLQEFQACDNPILIRIDKKAGHGAGKPTSKVIDESADVLSFSLYNMNYDI